VRKLMKLSVKERREEKREERREEKRREENGHDYIKL
jgi:hypothetical protein